LIDLPALRLCIALGLGAMAPGADSADVDTVPFITFGPQAPAQKGDDDFSQSIVIRVPDSVEDRLYLRVFDPDVGGSADEPTGLWNTETRFSLWSAGDAAAGAPEAGEGVSPVLPGPVLIDERFGESPETDGGWHTLGAFRPDQGESVPGFHLFGFTAQGLSGDDGNLFDLFISKDPSSNQAVPGLFMSSERPTLSVAQGPRRVAEARFSLPRDTSGLTIRHFDLDRAHTRLQLPFAEPVLLRSSGDGVWGVARIPLIPSDGDRVAAITIRGGRNLSNVVTLDVTDDGGKPLPILLPVQPFPLDTPPTPAGEYRIDSDCQTVHFDAAASRDKEGRLTAFLWDFGDGQTGAGQRILHRYSKPGTYEVLLTVVDDSGRVADRSRVTLPVKVNRPPEPSVKHRQVAAPGEPVLFDAGGSRDPDGEIESFSWDFGDGQGMTGSRATHIYPEPGVYDVRLRATDDGPGPCATSETTVQIRINAAPAAAAGDDRRVAVDETLALDASASQDVDGTLEHFHWDFGDGKQATGPLVEHAYSAPGSYIVTLTVEDDSGVDNSRSTDRLAVTVNQRPVAAVSGPTRGAVGEKLGFDASASTDPDGSIIQYRWDFGDGTEGEGVRVEHAYAKPGSHEIVLTVRDDSGTASEEDAARLGVAVNDPPVPDAGADQHVTASEVRFDGTGSRDPDGKILKWTWDFGDGTSGEGPQPSHVYGVPGRYRVTLRVTDDSGTSTDSASDTLDLVVNRKPIADAGPDLTAAPGEGLVFDGSGSFDPDGAITDYRWNFGDGTTGEGVRAEHVYATPGLYSVRLEVRDDSGHAAAIGVADALIMINAPPVPVAGPDRLVAPGQPVELNAGASSDPDGEILSYRWTFSDDHADVQGPVVKRSFPEPGSYTAELEVTDDSGASNGFQRDGLIVRVNHPPVAVAGTPIRSCSPWVELDGSAARDADGDRLRFIWTLGDGREPVTGPRVTYRFPEGGRFPVLLRVDDGTGLVDSVHDDSTEVWINRPPVAVAEGPGVACAGETILFNGAESSDPDGGPLLYRWDFGDGTAAGGVSPAKSYPEPGSYEVVLRVEDDSGLPCNSSEDRLAVTVADAPVADAGEDRTVCSSMPVTFDGTGSRDFDGVVNGYGWDFGDGAKGGGPNPSHVYTQAGDYEVTLTVTGDRIGDCPNQNSDQIRLRVLDAPRVVIEAPGRITTGAPVSFTAAPESGNANEGHGELVYRWDFGDGTSGEGSEVEHRFDVPGRYAIVMTAEDPDGGECSRVRVDHALLVDSPPEAVAGEDLETAPGDFVVFDGSESADPDGAIGQYLWDFGDGEKADGVQAVHRYAEPGVYAARLTVVDNSDLPDNRSEAMRRIRVNAAPEPRMILTPDTPCAEEELVLDASSSHDPDGTLKSWTWDLGDGTTAEGGVVSHKYAEPGRYTAILTVGDGSVAKNASVRLNREIRVNTPPSVLMNIPVTGCPDTPLKFDASGSRDPDGDPLSFRWIFGNETESGGAEASHAYVEPGLHEVTLAVSDRSGSRCGTVRQSAGIRINSAPQAKIAPLRAALFVGGAHDEIQLDASGSHDQDGDPLTFHWDFGDGTEGRGSRVSHGYLEPGYYRVKLEVRDGSAGGCGVGTDELDIEVRRRSAGSDAPSGD
jgi:PKD repeat protein